MLKAIQKPDVIPAKAGIQFRAKRFGEENWIPAFAGMTI
jgi:hypothetical protein